MSETEANFDMEKFPDDALLGVFHFLPLSDRIRLESVNKHWRRLLMKSWADANTVIIWKNGIYEEISSDMEVDPVYVAPADTEALVNVLKRAGGNLKWLKLVDNCNVDGAVMTAIAQCRNLEELELHKVMFTEDVAEESVQMMENVLTLPRLSTVAWNQNTAYDDCRQLPNGALGGIRLTTFPSLNSADAFTAMRGLRRLHLEDAPILWGNFVFVCVQLAPTLEEFCYKVWDNFLVPLRCTLMRGLQHLTNLKQLNLSGDRKKMRPLGGLLDDEFAQFVSCVMPRMERLSLKGAERLGTKGLQGLLRNLPRLQYLNVSQCDSINNSALEAACETRDDKGAYLTVYASETEVRVGKLDIKQDGISVLTDPRFIDESVFFGEMTMYDE